MPISSDCAFGIHSSCGEPCGPTVVGISPVGEVTETGTGAQRWVMEDGSIYWIKTTATDGLSAELIAGRLAHHLGIGAPVSAVRLAIGDEVVFGSRDITGAVNSRDLKLFIPDLSTFDLAALDQATLGRTFAFQVWIGHSDPQWLIDFEDGRVYSSDHEKWHSDNGYRLAPRLLSARVPGMPDYLRAHGDITLDGVAAIEALTDETLILAVSAVPDMPAWRYDTLVAMAVADALADRRDSLRGVIESWLTS